MFDYHLSFDRPGYLLLLGLLPVVWLLGQSRLAGLGRWRRGAAFALRTLLIALLVLALAETQIVRTLDRVAVVYLVDASLSMSKENLAQAVEYVNASARKHRNRLHEDRVGIIIFGREAAVELPPMDDDVRISTQFEAQVDGEGTNLADALRLAQAIFPAEGRAAIAEQLTFVRPSASNPIENNQPTGGRQS